MINAVNQKPHRLAAADGPMHGHRDEKSLRRSPLVHATVTRGQNRILPNLCGGGEIVPAQLFSEPGASFFFSVPSSVSTMRVIEGLVPLVPLTPLICALSRGYTVICGITLDDDD